jgi:hypothetical protein
VLVSWINSKLPPGCPQATDLSTSLSSGLILFRLVEAIHRTDYGVPDSAFSQGRVDGLFKLFKLLRSNDVRDDLATVEDVQSGNQYMIILLVRGIQRWDEQKWGPTSQLEPSRAKVEVVARSNPLTLVDLRFLVIVAYIGLRLLL